LRSDALAYGHLGIIWDACYEAGDDNIGSAEDVEYLARWQGEGGKLASALLESGFIDADGSGVHRVHDLYDHAPDYVQRRMEREHQRRAKGVTISELRAKAGKASGEARRKQAGTNDEQVTNTCSTNDEHMTNKREQTAQLPAPNTQHPTPAPIGEVSPITPLAAPRRKREKRIPVTAADILNDLVIPPELGHDTGSKQAIRDWLEHKDRIRNQYASAKSFAVELSRWAKIGPERFACAVAYSIGKEWKGIYEEQANGNGRPNPKPKVTIIPNETDEQRYARLEREWDERHGEVSS
jgi:hypothetical protein